MKRPTTAQAVLRMTPAVVLDQPTRVTNATTRERLDLASITFGNVQRVGSADFLRCPSRTSFVDSPAKGELPATATTLAQSKRSSL